MNVNAERPARVERMRDRIAVFGLSLVGFVALVAFMPLVRLFFLPAYHPVDPDPLMFCCTARTMRDVWIMGSTSVVVFAVLAGLTALCVRKGYESLTGCTVDGRVIPAASGLVAASAVALLLAVHAL